MTSDGELSPEATLQCALIVACQDLIARGDALAAQARRPKPHELHDLAARIHAIAGLIDSAADAYLSAREGVPM